MAKKKKLRVMWLSEWHIEEHEAWFEDMIKQGWKLEKINMGFATFVEAEPQELRYRIEIANKDDDIESDRIHLYDDAGWDYITNENYMYVFLERKPNTAKEIHSDPAMQAETIEILKKSIFRRGVGLFLITFLMFLLMYFSINDTSSYYLLSNSMIQPIIYILLYLPLSIYWIYGIIHISSLVKRLKNGEELKRDKPYRAKLNWLRFGNIVLISLLIATFSYWIYLDEIFSSHDMYLEIPEGQLPVVSLMDIEDVNSDEVTYSSTSLENRWSNTFQDEASILFPNQYYLRQQFIIPEAEPFEYEPNYEPFLDSRNYESRFEWMAKKLVEALVGERRLSSEGQFTIENDFDDLRLFEGNNQLEIIARAGKEVYHIYYNGSLSSNEVLESLLEFMQNKS